MESRVEQELKELIQLAKARNNNLYKGYYTPQYVDKLTKKIIAMEKLLNESSGNRD